MATRRFCSRLILLLVMGVPCGGFSTASSAGGSRQDPIAAVDTDLVSTVESCHKAVGGYDLGDTSAWLTVAYAASGFRRISTLDFAYNQVKTYGRAGAMAIVGYAGSNFNPHVSRWYKTHSNLGDTSAWLAMARGASNMQHEDKIDETYSYYSRQGEAAGIITLAYAASGFDDEVKSVYDSLNVGIGNYNRSAWLTLAYVAGHALHDPAKQKQIRDYVAFYEHGQTEAAYIIGVSYAALDEGKSGLLAAGKEFGFADLSGNALDIDKSRALLLLAYAIAKNPDNGLLPKKW